jgi:hypothetical protein
MRRSFVFDVRVRDIGIVKGVDHDLSSETEAS